MVCVAYFLSIIGILLLFAIWGCTTTAPSSSPPPKQPPGYPKPYKVWGKWYQPLPDSKGFRQRGLPHGTAKTFMAKKTSNGEIYNMHAMTAAHKTLPLGTHVRVHNLENGKKTDVRINDRGPFVRGRIIDLSYSGAKKIGLVGPGTAKVEIFALGSPSTTDGGTSRSYVQRDMHTGNFTFQVGAFLNRENAERLKRELAQSFKNAHIAEYDNGEQIFYRVRVGKVTTLEQADKYEEYLIQNGFPDAFVVAE